MDKSSRDNHANQSNSNNQPLNHNNSAYKGGQDNRSSQLNPNSSQYKGGKGSGSKKSK